MTYIEPDIGDDEGTIITDMTERVQAVFPNWLPVRGGLLYLLMSGLAFVIAEFYGRMRLIGETIFSVFLTKMAGIPANPATPSTATSTWTSSTSSFTVPAGALVGIDDGAGSLVAFEVVADISTTDGSAENVQLVSLEVGEFTAGLTGPVTVLDSLSFDPVVSLVGATQDGTDAEDPAAHRSRGSERLRLSSDDVILGDDAATMARQVAGVWRAMVVDNYDVDTDDDAAEGKIAVALQGFDGAAVSGPVEDEARELVESSTILNLSVGFTGPEAQAIDAKWDFVPHDGWDPADVKARSEANVTAFLESKFWGGLPYGDEPVWRPVMVVHLYDVAQAILATEGLDYIKTGTLQIRLSGGSWGTTDVTLGTKPWSIAEPGSVTGTATT